MKACDGCVRQEACREQRIGNGRVPNCIECKYFGKLPPACGRCRGLNYGITPVCNYIPNEENVKKFKEGTLEQEPNIFGTKY